MDLQKRCDNESWATVRVLPTLDRYGNDVALVVAKLAYHITARGRVTLDHRPVRWSEVPDDFGGLRYPSDLCDDKPGTDLGLVGTAHPPSGKQVDRFMAYVSMGSLRKVVQISGKRAYIPDFRGPAPGPPMTAGPTPLRYDLCFGGTDDSPAPPNAPPASRDEPRNPVGKGHVLDSKTLVGKEAHRLDPVGDALGPAPDPCHGCFGPIPANWEPRRSLVGTHDHEWSRTRAPLRPKDFDRRHHIWAVPGLHSDKPLVGDETVEVGGVRKEGLWRFTLPRYEPTFESRTAEGLKSHKTHLDSILIDADESTVELSWRAAIPLPLPWELLGRLRVWSPRVMPPEVLEEDGATGTARI